jgi:type IV secretory pathway TrbD component
MSSSELPAGHAPLHRSLTVPLLTAGLPDNMAITLWVGAAGFGMILHQAWIIPPAIACHVIAALVTRWDPHFFRILRPALHARHRLDP